MAKGRDLEEAALTTEGVKTLRANLKENLLQYSNRLEVVRERIEGAVRLSHLLSLDLKEQEVQLEMQKLAEKIGAHGLIERYRNIPKVSAKEDIKREKTITMAQDTVNNSCVFWRNESLRLEKHYAETEFIKNHNGDSNADDDEDSSKIADSLDSGLVRTCSCQSFDEPTSKSNNSDDMEEDCFDKGINEYEISPLKPNAHLRNYSPNITLSELENPCGLAPKTQKSVSNLSVA